MNASADLSRLFLQLGDLDLPVLAVSGEESLSRPFRYACETLAPDNFVLSTFSGFPALLHFYGPDDRFRTVCGIVTAIENIGPAPGDRQRITITLESSLVRLRLQRDTRVFLDRCLPEIVSLVLQDHGIVPEQFRFRLTRTYPVRPWTLQVEETDLDFLQRLLARAGIFYWSEVEENREILFFTDHNSHCDHHPADLSREETGIQHIQVHRALAPDDFLVHERGEDLPSSPLIASAKVPGADGPFLRQTYFAPGVTHLDQAENLAHIHVELAGVISGHLTVRNNVADLYPGLVVSLDASGLADKFSGDYLVTGVSLKASQYAGHGVAGEDHAFTSNAILVPRERPYRPPLLPHPEIPFTFTARVESTGPLACLDEQGRYRLRAEWDRSSTAYSEGSCAIRRLSPHTGPSGEQPSGFHTPLRDGVEVLMSCLNGDPDRPVIVGSLPNRETASPVNAQNRSQNRLRTASDNELLMDDAVENEVIRLRTFGGQNMLELDAAALGHKIRMATERGALQWQAGKTLAVQSGDTLTESSGGDRVQTVENRHCSETRTGEIHHQAKTDIRQRAAGNIALHSGKNTEITSGKRLRLDVAHGHQLTVKGPEAIFTVNDGHLHIQATQDIRIEGQGGGDITFGQAGGGFVIDPVGNVRIFGKQLTVKGSGGVGLNGDVNSQIGQAEPMAEQRPASALRRMAIADLSCEEKAPQVQDIEIHLHDFYDNQLPGHFEDLKGLKWRLVSDCGEERTGILESSTIKIKGLRVKESVEFDIENLDLIDRERLT